MTTANGGLRRHGRLKLSKVGRELLFLGRRELVAIKLQGVADLRGARLRDLRNLLPALGALAVRVRKAWSLRATGDAD